MSPTSSPGDSSPSLQSSNINNENMASNEEQARLFAERNSEERHKAVLAAALAEHTRVRETALRVIELEQLRESTELLRQQRIQAEERNRLETEQAMEKIRIREEEDKAKQIPQPPPRVPTPPAPAPPQAAATKAPQSAQAESQPAATPQTAEAPNPKPKIILKINGQSSKQASTAANSQTPTTASQLNQKLPAASPVGQPQPSASQSTKVQPSPATPTPNQLNQGQAAAKAPSTTMPIPQPQAKSPQSVKLNYHPFDHLHPAIDRFVEIHKTLKQLRQFIKAHGDQQPEFKKKAGDMRRTITRSVGQLTEGAGVNKVPYQTILAQLNDSLTSIPSPPCNPALVMAITPQPTEGSEHNGESMPSLTIYLLNILVKTAISQFCSEAGANPKAADPIGVILVSVFSQPKYFWRGKSLVDILFAKMRVVCPVLFGIRGSDKTEEGRARLGWRKDENGKWISEQEHNDRMTGLGAGFASLCFRDFSKTRLVNPCPPNLYWHALASIILTPRGETSSTQFVVLKAMIDNYVKMFLTFYGSIGFWALRSALNEFPLRADKDNVAASSLKVLGEKINRDTGLMVYNTKAPSAQVN